MLKKYLFIVLYSFIISTLFYSSPFNGNWVVELYQVEPLSFIDINDNTCNIKSDKENIIQTMIINEEKATIELPFFSDISDKFNYVIKPNGTIDLYINCNSNSQLLNSFSTKGNKYVNTVTQDSSELFVDSMKTALCKLPMIRFIPYNKELSLAYFPELISGSWSDTGNDGNSIIFLIKDQKKVEKFKIMFQ